MLLASEGAREGTVVWADEQQHGRGRNQRMWHSPPGNLYCSIILRPLKLLTSLGGFSLIASLAVAKSIEELVPNGSAISLKWPNDVLINGKKTAGILIEAGTMTSRVEQWVVIGCGINIISFPEESEFPATSLKMEAKLSLTVKDVLHTYLKFLFSLLKQWRECGLTCIRDAWLHRVAGLGEVILIRLNSQEFEARFLNIDESGALIIELPNGVRKKITAADVFLLGRNHDSRY